MLTTAILRLSFFYECQFRFMRNITIIAQTFNIVVRITSPRPLTRAEKRTEIQESGFQVVG